PIIYIVETYLIFQLYSPSLHGALPISLIAASPTLFNVVKLAGALYLIYLGSRFILGTFGKEQADDPEQPRIRPEASLRSLLTRGFITTLTNPKVLLFFVSFF